LEAVITPFAGLTDNMPLT